MCVHVCCVCVHVYVCGLCVRACVCVCECDGRKARMNVNDGMCCVQCVYTSYTVYIIVVEMKCTVETGPALCT